MIRDPKPWFEYAEARNITSHAYDQKKAEIVLLCVSKFLNDAEAFYKVLELLNASND